ncbi:MAG TPA: hypothetical protein PKD64_12975 [Pirellulaceae bacterium]|nr:hypothetical protein [Pirellulaceae bacterium]HMO93100.1 hypothetical protein [Pirellulaceae bacterium]HMP69949.1 hypothetical protein [Pirellulaceae bacterium]
MLISLLVILVLTILICLALFQSARTWNWVNIVFVFLIFVAGILGAYAGSQTLKARYAWIDRSQKNEDILERYEKSLRETLNGPDDALAYTSNSLRGVNLELDLSMIGKGRVWQEASVSIRDEKTIVASFEAGGVDGANQLKQDTILYAFRDEMHDDQAARFPTTFIGTFQVESASGAQATLKSVFVTPDGVQDMSNPQTTWTFFEKMPVDDRETFKRLAGIPVDSDNFDIDAYRNILVTRYLTADLLGMDETSREYEELIDQFTFDGLTMGTIQNWIARQPSRISNLFDPGVENLYVELRFTKPSRGFQVDGSGSASENAFDIQGRAIDRSLHYGSEITFREGETIVVQKLTGVIGYDIADADGSIIREQPLINIMDVERVGGDDADIYRRPLNNYPHLLTQTIQQVAFFEDTLKQLEQVRTVADRALQDALTQQDLRARQLNDLEFDLENFQTDLRIVSGHASKLSNELADQQTLMDTLYKQIIKMYADIEASSNN